MANEPGTIIYNNPPNVQVVDDEGILRNAQLVVAAPGEIVYNDPDVSPNVRVRGEDGELHRAQLVAMIGSGGGGGGGDSHNLGYYETPEALRAAHPTATAGDFAIVNSTDTVWLWDTDKSVWVDGHKQGEVTSVNNKTGTVVLTASDVGAATSAQGALADTAVQPAAIADMETQTHAGTTYATKAELEDKQDILQYSTMPTASADNVGDIAQYVGTTQSYITNSVVTESDLSPDNPTVTIDSSKLSGLPISDSGGLAVYVEVEPETGKYVSFVSDSSAPEEYTFNSESCDTIEEAYAYFGITFSPSAPQFAEISYNSQTYTNGYFYKCTESSGSYSWAQTDVQPSPVIPDPLPSQTGQSGKYLTTDGSSASWGTINALQNTATGGYSLTILGEPTNRSYNINIGTQSGIFGLGGYNPPEQSIVIGHGAKIYGRYVSIDNIAIGYFAKVGDSSGSSSTVYGSGNIAIGANSVAYSTDYDNSGSIAIGKQAKTTRANSIAIGPHATVSAIGAIQLGENGTNDEAGTLKVRLGTTWNGVGWANYKLLDSDGTIPEARIADTTSATQGQVLTLDANLNATWAASSGLPDQTDQSGKFLTTDGSAASWGTINALQNEATTNNGIQLAKTSYGTDAPVIIGGGASRFNYGIVALGPSCTAQGSNSISIGWHSVTNGTAAIAIGYKAEAKANYAIQLGYWWSNTTPNTFKVGNANGNFEIMSADGTIPTNRFTTTPSEDGTYVPTLTISGGVPTRSWATPSGGGGVPTLTWYTVDTAGNTLTIADTSSAQLVKVYKNGLLLQPTEDYSISGTTLTTVTALVVGDKITTEVF